MFHIPGLGRNGPSVHFLEQEARLNRSLMRTFEGERKKQSPEQLQIQPPSNVKILEALERFKTYVNKHYSSSNIDGFIKNAQTICNQQVAQESQSQYDKRIGRQIMKLAEQQFKHRNPAILRLLADLVFIPLGILTFGIAFAIKYEFTGSSTFFFGQTKTHRQDKLDECLREKIVFT